MAGYTDQFLADLARLLRHGQQPLSQLIADLNDPEKRKQLTQALEHLQNMVITPPQPRQQGQTSKRREPPINLPIERSEDPEKYDLLSRLAKQLLEVETFKDRRQLARIAAGLQINVGTKDSRARIIQKIVNKTGEFSIDQVRKVANDIHMMETGTSESFKELAGFITRGPIQQ